MPSSSSSVAQENGHAARPSSSISDEHAEAAHAVEEAPNDKSKLMMFLGILRKFIGVKDMASVRFSLPAQLLEPIPNLEYWNYLDRPETFTSIGDSDEPLDRMLEVLRFWCTKDLKFIKNRPCKAYNSTLGEFFRCNWEITEKPHSIKEIRKEAESKSAASSRRTSMASMASIATREPTTKLDKPIRVSYITEQTSHHPPVSAFYVECPEKGISAKGFDQLAAKFTGTSVKVSPGEHNMGIFITLHKRDEEEYQLTHPSAHVGGLLRGSLTLSVGDMAYTTCPKTKMKTIMHYHEEGWLGKAQNKMEGIIFRYDPENDDKTQIKQVPQEDIVAKIGGNWKEKIFVSFAPDFKTQVLLIDLTSLDPAQKATPPLASQLPNESLRFWDQVTQAIKNKQYGRATQLKHEIEERQRAKLKERQAAGDEWTPRFFTGAVTPLGRPELTRDGEVALKKLEEGDYKLEENKVYGA